MKTLNMDGKQEIGSVEKKIKREASLLDLIT
jgi:hypothetical protein